MNDKVSDLETMQKNNGLHIYKSLDWFSDSYFNIVNETVLVMNGLTMN